MSCTYGTCGTCERCRAIFGQNVAEIVREQAAPIPSDRPAVWDLVIADMHQRNIDGTAKYGTPLQAHNGRDPLIDAYQEALDLCVYLRQAIEERKTSGGSAPILPRRPQSE